MRQAVSGGMDPDTCDKQSTEFELLAGNIYHVTLTSHRNGRVACTNQLRRAAFL